MSTFNRRMHDVFINIDKPVGVTSQAIDRRLRREFNVKRVGHAGTLDPFASGVLPIALGRAAKFIDFLTDEKSYRAQLLFGRATDTADCTGQTLVQLDELIMPTADRLNDVLNKFIGTIEQTPPKFSAIKLNGRKAYELARRSIDFDIPTRTVVIDRLELVSIAGRLVTVDVDCRKGTYIRSLAVDIGNELGLPVVLNALRRTRSSGFTIDQASDVDEIRAESIREVDQCLAHLPSIDLNVNRRKAFLNGLPTNLNRSSVDAARVYCQDEFLGLGSIVNGELRAVKLFRIE